MEIFIEFTTEQNLDRVYLFYFFIKSNVFEDDLITILKKQEQNFHQSINNGCLNVYHIKFVNI